MKQRGAELYLPGTCNGLEELQYLWDGHRKDKSAGLTLRFWSTQRWRYETEPDQQQKGAGIYSRLPSVLSKLSAASAIMEQ